MYSTDLAYIHDAGFGDYARRAAPEIARALRARGITRGTVVEFGCGGGVVARRLSAAGYDVLGVDISPAMIRLARQRAPAAAFRVGSIASAAIPRCDAIVSNGEVVAYIAGPDTTARQHQQALAEFFLRARAALTDRGMLIFDFMESSVGRTYPHRARKGPDWAIALRASVDRRGQVLTRRLTTTRRVAGRVRRSRETHRLRLYSRAEMAALLRHAGFRFVMKRSIGSVPMMRSDLAVFASIGG
jgi:SAM-dependent methyltransferase